MENLLFKKLRKLWKKHWGQQPHRYIGRTMLETSVDFKLWEKETGGAPPHLKKQLDELLRKYRDDREVFMPKKINPELKPGTYLDRTYKGKKYSVLVTDNGFEYEGKTWSSLTSVANHITGKKWNGWSFFKLK